MLSSLNSDGWWSGFRLSGTTTLSAGLIACSGVIDDGNRILSPGSAPPWDRSDAQGRGQLAQIPRPARVRSSRPQIHTDFTGRLRESPIDNRSLYGLRPFLLSSFSLDLKRPIRAQVSACGFTEAPCLSVPCSASPQTATLADSNFTTRHLSQRSTPGS